MLKNNYILQDWSNNKSNLKGKIILILFRTAQILRHKNKLLFYISIPYLIFYRIIIEWFLCVELPWNTKIGSGLCIFHGQGLVINDNTVIGKNCILRQNTTIGHKKIQNNQYSKAPIIKDNVDVGANVIIIGEVIIGEHSIIGAGAVVTKDVAPYSIVAGNPAKIIKRKVTHEENITNT